MLDTVIVAVLSAYYSGLYNYTRVLGRHPIVCYNCSKEP